MSVSGSRNSPFSPGKGLGTELTEQLVLSNKDRRQQCITPPATPFRLNPGGASDMHEHDRQPVTVGGLATECNGALELCRQHLKRIIVAPAI